KKQVKDRCRSVMNREFTPGEVWKDTEGQPIQAHGGGMLYHEGVYYWYGENKETETLAIPVIRSNGEAGTRYRTNVIGVSCYTSTDLLNWKNEGVVLKAVADDPQHDLRPENVLERPKVIYNEASGSFVMWMHIDTEDYQFARAGV